MVSCPLCGLEVSSRSSLSRHMARKHVRAPAQCPQCLFVAKNMEHLRTHKRRWHSRLPPCRECLAYLPTQTLLMQHEQLWHTPPSRRVFIPANQYCPTCHVWFGSRNLKRHTRICTGNETSPPRPQRGTPEEMAGADERFLNMHAAIHAQLVWPVDDAPPLPQEPMLVVEGPPCERESDVTDFSDLSLRYEGDNVWQYGLNTSNGFVPLRMAHEATLLPERVPWLTQPFYSAEHARPFCSSKLFRTNVWEAHRMRVRAAECFQPPGPHYCLLCHTVHRGRGVVAAAAPTHE